MKLNRKKILQMLEKNTDTIRGFGVRRLGLFGSFAKGEASDMSDIDFLVEFERKTFDAYMELKDYLERLFNCRVDLVIEDALKPRLRLKILSEVIHASGL
ncbi:MAG: nucleotidyltransferase family protein [Deltaproteobacteria bacterium]